MSAFSIELGVALIIVLVECLNSVFTRGEKIRLSACTLLVCLLSWWLGALFHVPTFPGFSISLFQQQSPIVAMLMVAILVCVSSATGAIVMRNEFPDAGLRFAAIALVALSATGGTSGNVLMAASAKSVYLVLAVETVILGALLALAGGVQQRLVRKDELGFQSSFAQRALATIAGAGVCGVLILLLAQTDQKLQVIIVVAVAGYAGAIAAHQIAPGVSTRCIVMLPLACGVIAYVVTYFTDASGWIIGEARGILSAMARPLPLDYAGAGVAGAITGLWHAKSWHPSSAPQTADAHAGGNSQPPGSLAVR